MDYLWIRKLRNVNRLRIGILRVNRRRKRNKVEIRVNQIKIRRVANKDIKNKSKRRLRLYRVRDRRLLQGNWSNPQVGVDNSHRIKHNHFQVSEKHKNKYQNVHSIHSNNNKFPICNQIHNRTNHNSIKQGKKRQKQRLKE